jgi:hypothetical protein
LADPMYNRQTLNKDSTAAIQDILKILSPRRGPIS